MADLKNTHCCLAAQHLLVEQRRTLALALRVANLEKENARLIAERGSSSSSSSSFSSTSSQRSKPAAEFLSRALASNSRVNAKLGAGAGTRQDAASRRSRSINIRRLEALGFELNVDLVIIPAPGDVFGSSGAAALNDGVGNDDLRSTIAGGEKKRSRDLRATMLESSSSSGGGPSSSGSSTVFTVLGGRDRDRDRTRDRRSGGSRDETRAAKRAKRAKLKRPARTAMDRTSLSRQVAAPSALFRRAIARVRVATESGAT